MKTYTAFALAVLLAAASPADAQDPARPRLVRGDAAGWLEWLSTTTERANEYEDRHAAFLGSLSAGWYWTDHLKTELRAGANTDVDEFASRPISIGGRTVGEVSTITTGHRRISVSQQYQFGRNQWFHPFLGAGVEVVRERSRRVDMPIYDFTVRQNQLLRPEITHPARTKVEAHGLVSGGFKAYVHPRAFFTSELRATVGSRLETVVLGFGLGADF